MFHYFNDLRNRPYFWLGTVVGIVLVGLLRVSLG